MEDKIKEVLEEIRPYLQRDGGDLEFIGYTEDKVVQVKLMGACDGCPYSQMTIKGGVERILKEHIPEIAGVEAV